MNAPAAIGHNNPPDPIELALQPYRDLLMEAENWIDGTPIENDVQLECVEVLAKSAKTARKTIDVARDEQTRPLHEAWKAEIARWKPAQDDLDRVVSCLVAAMAPYKKAKLDKIAAEQAEARRLADIAASEARIAVKQAAYFDGDILAQRNADALLKEAEIAAKAASASSKQTVKGMRIIKTPVIEDRKAAFSWIVRNLKPQTNEFIDRMVQLYGKNTAIDGVRVDITKEAF